MQLVFSFLAALLIQVDISSNATALDERAFEVLLVEIRDQGFQISFWIKTQTFAQNIAPINIVHVHRWAKHAAFDSLLRA